MKYLSVKDIVTINLSTIQRYSPKEPHGIVDAHSLHMIVEQPKQEIFGQSLYPSLASKAAILWINLIKKHPFRNANKRTAFLAMHLFCRLNGYQTAISFEDGLQMTLYIATFQGAFDQLKEEVTTFLEQENRLQKQ